jgi:hypothetical protein
MSSLIDAVAQCRVTRDDVTSARLSVLRAKVTKAAADAKIGRGEMWPGASEALGHSLAAANAFCVGVETQYDAPRKNFLRVNRDEFAAAAKEHASAMQRIAELQRGAALDEISIAEANGFQKLADASLANEKDTGVKLLLAQSVQSSADKLNELRDAQANKRRELNELKSRLPAMSKRLDDLIGELAV